MTTLSRYALKMACERYGLHSKTIPKSIVLLVGVTVPPYVTQSVEVRVYVLEDVVIRLLVVSESW